MNNQVRADEFEQHLEYLYENYKFLLFVLAKLVVDHFDREFRNANQEFARLRESHARRLKRLNFGENRMVYEIVHEMNEYARNFET